MKVQGQVTIRGPKNWGQVNLLRLDGQVNRQAGCDGPLFSAEREIWSINGTRIWQEAFGGIYLSVVPCLDN